MKKLTFLLIGLALAFIPFGISSQTLPPRGADEIYVIVGPGGCKPQDLIEIGTYKPDLDETWTRSPRKFVGQCEVFTEKTFVARYRLAVRCVDSTTLGSRGPWIRSLSGLDKPWPVECPGPQPAAPVNPDIP